MVKYEFFNDQEVKDITKAILGKKDYPMHISYSNCEAFEDKADKWAELIKIVRSAEAIEGKLYGSVQSEVMGEMLKGKESQLENKVQSLVKHKLEEIIKSL